MRALRWLLPGMHFKRWLFLNIFGAFIFMVGLIMTVGIFIWGRIEYRILSYVYNWTGAWSGKLIGVSLMGLGMVGVVIGVREMTKSITAVVLPEGEESLVDLFYQKRYLNRGPKVVVIGGGSGLSVLLRGLKQYTTRLAAVVTMADDGGSSGRLRDELGVLPPGDVRNCLIAMADTEPLLKQLFQHRFTSGGGLQGHSFGNLFLAAMTEVVGDFEQAIKESSKVLAVRGQVLPSTIDDVTLVAEFDDGAVVRGESQIGRSNRRVKRVKLEPSKPAPLKEALAAIAEADAIVLGPGSLYTSILPNLLVRGIADAVRRSPATVIYVCNVMTQPGETTGYKASDHVRAIIDHVGPKLLDYAIINTGQVPEEFVERYREEGGQRVEPDLQAIRSLGVKVITDSFVSHEDYIRHDANKLAKNIIHLVVRERYSLERRRALTRHLRSEK